VRVCLLTGDGGAGKTRLALRLCTELSANGWQPLWVHPGTEGKAAEAVRQLGPCVLVVDYAETRDALRAMLSEVVADTSAPDVRVLLLARGPGEWWQRLINSSEERVARLLAEPPVMLGPLQVEGGPSMLFDQALTAFADKLQVARPDVGFMLTDPEPVMLEVHAAALLAVLDHAQGGDDTSLAQSATEALDGLLGHESRYWAQSAAARGLDLDVAVQRLVVAVGCLIGADSETAAAALMTRIPDLADSAERRGQVARWLHDLYPEARPDEAQAKEWIGPLRPDPVAEHLVVGELSSRPELVPGLFADLGEDRAARALTVLARAAHTPPRALDLARAWTHQEDAQRLIANALNADLAHLAVPAAQVAIETRSDLGTLLAAAFQGAPISQNALIRVVAALPYPSVVLAQAHLAAALRVRTSLTRDAGPAVIAEWSDKVGVLLIQLGRVPEAMRYEQEAIAIYRELAQTNPGRHRANLAQSLMNLGAGLSQMGRLADALPAEEEAIDIWRELAQTNEGRYRRDLAGSLSNLGVSLSELGRHADALPIAAEAVTIRRELAQANPDHYRPDFAQSLTNLGWSLSGLGRHADAFDAEQEAVGIYRELVRINPDRYRPDLAQSLTNLGVSLSELGHHDEAQLATREAVTIRRELAQANPSRYHPNLAQSLTSLGNRLTELGRHDEAQPVIKEAVAIYRELAQTDPGRYRPKLATSLTSLGNELAKLGRHNEALLSHAGRRRHSPGTGTDRPRPLPPQPRHLARCPRCQVLRDGLPR